MKIKTTKWIAVCMVAMMGLFAIGCDSGSDETESPSLGGNETGGSGHGGNETENPTPGNGDQLTLSDTTLTIPLNGIGKLTVTPAGTTVVWSSSNDEIATVDKNGIVTGNKVGTATITATSGDNSATCAVTVAETVLTDSPSSGGDITLNYKEYTLTPKSTLLLKVTPAGTKVEWSTGYTADTATVSENGRLAISKSALNKTNNSHRTITITAKTAEGKEAKCEITICAHSFDETSKKCRYCEFPLPIINDGNGEIDKVGELCEWCSNIVDEKVEIPEGVVGIYEKAFSGRTNTLFHPNTSGFKSVTIPSSMWSFSENAFYGCENLKDVYYNGTKEEWGEILFLGSGVTGLADDVTIHGYEADGITETTWKYKEE